MINISNVVQEILEGDQNAYITLQNGYMNLSSYARIIKPEVEKRSYKGVELKSIVVALSRLAVKLEPISKPEIKILNLSVHAGLAEVSYYKTKENIAKARELYKLIPEEQNKFFTVTMGLTEITIIGDFSVVEKVKEVFEGQKHSYKIRSLTGITLKFPIYFLNVPNFLHSIHGKLASKKINIVELVSTTTEITFVIQKKYMEEAVKELSKLL